ncbi:hypothetical protein GNY06_00330, partial [Elizabethkingia argentiflava]|nr:hypothetical protein [Elizabethkingia argenteiflava]
VVRKSIYTTNPIQGVHRQIRKITKTKGAFPSEQALMKLMYLEIQNISKKWTMPIHNWGIALSQLYVKFGENSQGKKQLLRSINLEPDTVRVTLPHLMV